MLLQMARHSIRHHRNSRMTREALLALQRRRFRGLARQVYEKSPYYRAVMKERGIDAGTCTPEEFPVLTKGDLLEHFDSVVTDRRITKAGIQEFLARSSNPGDLFLGRYYVIHTSGSSGQIGYYLYRPEEMACGIAYPTRGHWLGIGQRMAFVGSTRGHFAAATIIRCASKLWPLFREVRAFDVHSPFKETIEALNDMQPDTLTGYPGAIGLLAEAQQRGELHIRPRMIQCGGEPLAPHECDAMRAAFGAPVVNDYVCSEGLFMGIAAPGSDDLDLMEDEILFEIHPDHTCITNLFNRTLPLIRYRMDDMLQPLPDTERRGPFRRIAGIVGRKEHAPVLLNRHGERDFIYPTVLEGFYVEHLSRFQVHILCDQHLLFRACLSPGLPDRLRKATLAQIRDRLRGILDAKAMTNVSLDVEEVASIGPDPTTGKFRLIHQTPAACNCGTGQPCAERSTASG